MSSLDAKQADGYYLPQSILESGANKKKAKNQIAGNNGHNQYEAKRICRFKLPYNEICMNKKLWAKTTGKSYVMVHASTRN